jgi:thiol-disulfide isomerase/thioredoxin
VRALKHLLRAPLIWVGLLLGPSLCAQIQRGVEAPEFGAQDMGGKEVGLSDYRGKVIVLDFWATWCGPCLAAMPHTQKVAGAYKGQGVVVLGSCTDDERVKFKSWVKQNQAKYPDIVFSHDPAERGEDRASHRLYGVNGIPTQYIIGRDGRVVDVVVGYLPGDARLETALAKAGIKIDSGGWASAAPAANGQPGGPPAEARLPEPIRSHLVLCYNFEAPAVGARLRDRSGHGNDGVPVNVQFVTDDHRGGGASFGGADSQITVPNRRDLSPAQFTLSVWIKTAVEDRAAGGIFGKGGGAGFDLTMGGDRKGRSFPGQISFASGQSWVLSGIRVNDGQWHHVVGTYDGAHAWVYVDGWQMSRLGRAEGDPGKTSPDLAIGSSFNGAMADLMMFDRVFSAEGVRALFLSQGGVLAAPQDGVPLGRPAPVPAATGNPTEGKVAERLKELKQLRAQDLIDEETYRQKVKEILDSI